jgi:hypothetical protein
MLEICRSWQQRCPDDTLMHYYLGVALARTGEGAAAMPHLDRHLQLGLTGDSGIQSNRQPLSSARFEKMWLQVGPDSPTELRDPEAAGAALQEFLAQPKPLEWARGKPWPALVAAEVHFANGDRTEAIRWAEMARNALGADQEASPDDQARLIDAALARYRQQADVQREPSTTPATPDQPGAPATEPGK